MGVNKHFWEREKKWISEYKGLRLLELGAMWHRVEGRPAKKVYEGLGVEHYSIDLNGEHGSLVLDLGEPLLPVFRGYFDIVTNYGTIEHVNNQYQVFKNVHDALVVDYGGLAIHAFPMVETFKGHGRYYYDRDFVNELARLNNYRILNMEEVVISRRKNQAVLYVVLEKTKGDFISEDKFPLSLIYDSGDLKNTQNYTK